MAKAKRPVKKAVKPAKPARLLREATRASHLLARTKSTIGTGLWCFGVSWVPTLLIGIALLWPHSPAVALLKDSETNIGSLGLLILFLAQAQALVMCAYYPLVEALGDQTKQLNKVIDETRRK